MVIHLLVSVNTLIMVISANMKIYVHQEHVKWVVDVQTI